MICQIVLRSACSSVITQVSRVHRKITASEILMKPGRSQKLQKGSVKRVEFFHLELRCCAHIVDRQVYSLMHVV